MKISEETKNNTPASFLGHKNSDPCIAQNSPRESFDISQSRNALPMSSGANANTISLKTLETSKFLFNMNTTQSKRGDTISPIKTANPDYQPAKTSQNNHANFASNNELMDVNVDDSTSEWTTVINKLKRSASSFQSNSEKKIKHNINESSSNSHQNYPNLSNNKYGTLADSAECHTLPPTTREKPLQNINKSTTTLIQSEAGANALQQSNDNDNLLLNNVKKASFCPPIFIFGANCTLITDLLKLAATECKVSDLVHKFVNIGYRKTKVYVNNSAVHKLIIDRLRDTGIGAFSFPPKDTKKVSILLKGLDGDTPLEKIKKALGEIVPNVKISKIAPFSTSRTKDLNLKLNMFLVQLEVGESIKELTSVRYLLFQRVYWEKNTIEK